MSDEELAKFLYFYTGKIQIDKEYENEYWDKLPSDEPEYEWNIDHGENPINWSEDTWDCVFINDHGKNYYFDMAKDIIKHLTNGDSCGRYV